MSIPLRKYITFFFFVFLLVPVQGAGNIEEFLHKLPLKDLKVLEKEAFYSKIYEVKFRQPLNHRDTSEGYFLQRLYISHIDIEKPVVFVTEGYSADYYYTSEPASLLKCNQIIAEHRYFGKSKPDSLDWEYMNTWQAASDHHRIIEAFKEFYESEWITTGISKGGQSTIFHSYYYPDDVDVRIPYVAPLNNSVEDFRIYDFLDQVGSKKCRKKIKDFQEMALKRQEELIPVFEKYSDSRNYTYNAVGGVEKAFEYCVLEYPFAFWQWGYADCSDIPAEDAEPFDIIIHMNRVAGFDYFADIFVQEYQPFFFQAYTEMGYYGYEIRPFKDLLQYIEDGSFTFALPDNYNTKFSPVLLSKVDHYLKEEAENFIFIYGEYDTWSATAVNIGNNSNSSVFYKKKGSHRTRINNMPERQQHKVLKALHKYLED